MPTLASHTLTVENIKLHYLMGGTGDPVLLLHGFPTSSFLWRNVAPPMLAKNTVIALDLPGFGQSDKPLDVSYSFRFFDRILTQFLDALNYEKIGLGVHDVGGPLGLYWAIHHPERVQKLALLNTLVYPEFSWAVIAFVVALKIPGLRWLATSGWGLKKTLQIGVYDRTRLTPEAIAGIQAPFPTPESRRALIKAGTNLHPNGFKEIARALPNFKIPVRIIYGEKDRILPDVAKTMQRVAADLPQAVITSLPDCGHFLQEERPDEVGRLLAEFFAGE